MGRSVTPSQTLVVPLVEGTNTQSQCIRERTFLSVHRISQSFLSHLLDQTLKILFGIILVYDNYLSLKENLSTPFFACHSVLFRFLSPDPQFTGPRVDPW